MYVTRRVSKYKRNSIVPKLLPNVGTYFSRCAL